MAETEPSRTQDDPTTELTQRFVETAGVLSSAGGVPETLRRVVELALDMIDGCDFAGIFLREGDAFTTPVHTDPIVIEVDAVQHRYGEGPRLDVMESGPSLHVDDLADDDRWAHFGPAAAALGVRSVLALSLSGSGAHGALTLYARRPHAFGVVDQAKGLLLGGLAGFALSTAEAHADEARRIDNLQSALATRAMIGQAQGILIERERITPDQAFDLLRRASQHANVKLRDVAQALVDTGELPPVGAPPASP